MKTTTARKPDDNKQSGKLPKIGTGHRPHMSGAGKHKHKCDRRTGTRSQRIARIINEH